MKNIFLFLIIISSLLKSQTAYDFLRLDYSAKSSALGGSYTSNTDDPNVMFYNPAGVGYIKSKNVSIGYFKHLLDVNSGSIAFTPRIKGLEKFAFGLQYINYGTFDEKDEAGNLLGTFGSSQIAATVNYYGVLYPNVYYGGNFKMIYSNIADLNSFALGVDLGISYYDKEKEFSAGLSLVNMGSQVKSYYDAKESLPFDVRAGFSKRLEHLPFRFSLEFSRLNHSGEKITDRLKYFSIGGEFFLSKVLNLRLGYVNNIKQDMKFGATAGTAGFNLGLGIIISDYRFDYAISSLGKIGYFHRIALNLSY